MRILCDMNKNFLFFSKISLSERLFEFGGIFFLPRKIIWIDLQKKRIIQIFSREFYRVHWLNSRFRNEILIKKNKNQEITFYGFFSSYFWKIKFFFQKFYFRFIFPFYNFSPNNLQMLIQTGKKSFFFNQFLKKFVFSEKIPFYSGKKNFFFFKRIQINENFEDFFFLEKKKVMKIY